ncbi:MAG: hypothetical protein WD794_09965 [Mycobacteriales bacterium]
MDEVHTRLTGESLRKLVAEVGVLLTQVEVDALPNSADTAA